MVYEALNLFFEDKITYIRGVNLMVFGDTYFLEITSVLTTSVAEVGRFEMPCLWGERKHGISLYGTS